MNRFPIYPDFELLEFGKPKTITIEAVTSIRILGPNDCYYFWDVLYSNSFNRNDGFYMKKTMDAFIKECYAVIKLGQVDLKIVDQNKNPIFRKDPNQKPEEDRLRDLMNPKKQ
tara:strand:+ start:778 stop:1116 length:339 start_codon:yes stop_codon:yes gene_type:complete